MNNLIATHQISAKHFKSVTLSGLYRHQKTYIFSDSGETSYVATPPSKISGEMEKLFNDIENLLSAKMKIDEIFFYASMIHLIFGKLHPWEHGNGSTARLLEKWFIAQKMVNKPR